jgi:hypothetical protein
MIDGLVRRNRPLVGAAPGGLLHTPFVPGQHVFVTSSPGN